MVPQQNNHRALSPSFSQYNTQQATTIHFTSILSLFFLSSEARVIESAPYTIATKLCAKMNFHIEHNLIPELKQASPLKAKVGSTPLARYVLKNTAKLSDTQVDLLLYSYGVKIDDSGKLTALKNSELSDEAIRNKTGLSLKALQDQRNLAINTLKALNLA